MRWLPCGMLLITGCASVLGTKQAEFSFNSSPQQAQVFVDGSSMGRRRSRRSCRTRRPTP
jgi:hypothetical protein